MFKHSIRLWSSAVFFMECKLLFYEKMVSFWIIQFVKAVTYSESKLKIIETESVGLCIEFQRNMNVKMDC